MRCHNWIPYTLFHLNIYLYFLYKDYRHLVSQFRGPSHISPLLYDNVELEKDVASRQVRGRRPSHVLSRYAQQVQDLQGSRSRKPHMPCRAGKNCIVQLQETINSVHSTRCNGRPRLFAHFLYPPPSIVAAPLSPIADAGTAITPYKMKCDRPQTFLWIIVIQTATRL